MEPQAAAAPRLGGGPSPLFARNGGCLPAKGDVSSSAGWWHGSPTCCAKVEWRFEELLQAGHGLRRDKRNVPGVPITRTPLTRSCGPQAAPAAWGPAPVSPSASLGLGTSAKRLPQHQTLQILSWGG